MHGILERLPLLTMWLVNVSGSRNSRKKERKEKSSWKDRPLQGMYCQQTKDMTHTEKSY